MTEQEFISDVKQELSAACAMPVSPRDAEIKRIIKYAAQWFYRHYENAVEERYYVIPTSSFQLESYRRSRTIPMPDCVLSVTSFKKLRENWTSSMTFDGTTDMGLERIMFQSIDSSGASTEPVMYYAVSLYWLDTLNHLLSHTITYNYNPNSSTLFVGGETPDRDCVAMCYVKQSLEHLMNDEMFYRYVVGMAKMQMGRVMGTFDMTFPGGAKLNYDILREEGKAAVDEVKEEIKGQSAPDFFFTSGGS